MIWLQLLIASFAVPSGLNFDIGVLTLSPYRLLLLFVVPVIIYRVFTTKVHWRWFDLVAVILAGWPVVALSFTEGVLSAVESGGVVTLEMTTPYFLARVYVRSYEDLKKFWVSICTLIVVFVPIGLFEFATGNYFIHNLTNLVTGSGLTLDPEFRFIGYRAVGPAVHPIVFGGVCSLGIAASIAMARRNYKLWFIPVACIVGTVISLSSGPILIGLVHLFMVTWSTLTQGMRRKWLLLSILMLIAYVAIDIGSNRDPLRVVFSYLLFSAHNGYVRYEMWIQSIFLAGQSIDSILFGYGHSTDMFELVDSRFYANLMANSVDSYWLVLLLRFGWPMVVLHLILLVAVLVTGVVEYSNIVRTNHRRLLEATFVGAVGMSLLATTVHYWAYMACLYMVILSVVGAKPRVAERRIQREPDLDARDFLNASSLNPSAVR